MLENSSGYGYLFAGHVESFACQVSYLDENNALKILHYEVEVRFDAALPAKGEDMKSATEGET